MYHNIYKITSTVPICFQKTVIVSGYSETERIKEALLLGAGKYLKKPYTLEKIGVTLRLVLDSGQ
jgi:YesN/AraC family two-component response regulator